MVFALNDCLQLVANVWTGGNVNSLMKRGWLMGDGAGFEDVMPHVNGQIEPPVRERPFL